MKRRLLSIALTLMMVIALIPLGVASSAAGGHTVTFDTLGRGEAPLPIDLADGESILSKINEYDDLDLGAVGDYQFYEWSLKKNGDPDKDVYDLNMPVTNDITLYPIWKKAVKSVGFTYSGSAPKAGESIPENVTVTLNSGVTGAEIIEALWYNVNGTPATGNFLDNTVYFLRVDAAPKDGYLFRDSNGRISNESVWLKSSTLKWGGSTVNATFVKGSRYVAYSYFMFTTGNVKTYTLTFDANGHGTAPASFKVPEDMTLYQLMGESVDEILCANMFADNQIFYGWYNEDVLHDFIDYYATHVSCDLTLKAKWEASTPINEVEVNVRIPRVGDKAFDHFLNGDMAAVDPYYKAAINSLYTWYERADGTPFDMYNDVFEEGVTYYLRIDINPDSYYYFAGGCTQYGARSSGHLNLTINGDSYNYAPVKYDRYQVSARYAFVPLSASVKDLAISELSFSVEPPFAAESAGDENSFRINPGQNSFLYNGVVWLNPFGEGYYYGTFEYGQTYKYEAFLYAKNGYGFPKLSLTINATNTTVTGFERVSGGTLKVTGTVTPRLPFTDVGEGLWYTEAVGMCYSNGLMSGTTATTFEPGTPLSRAMFVTILSKLDAADTSEYAGSSFSDVPTGKWFSKPVEWAFKNGYASGIGGGKFGPNDPVSREQLAQFLYNYCKIKGYETGNLADLSKYTDAEAISGWAKTAMQWAVGNDLISGTTATTLSPKGGATRAQVAVIIMKYLRNIIAPIT